jgi:uncharacterized membrane protein
MIQLVRDELWVIITAALPVAELRAAIPLAYSLGMSPAKAYVLSVLGNMLPIPFLLLALWRYEKQLRTLPLIGRIIEWAVSRTMSKTDQIRRYGTIGLAIFVAIPLPSTGAWTAAIGAFLLRIGARYALPSIIAGVLFAGVIVTVITHSVSSILP